MNDSIATAHADSNAADQAFAQRLNLFNSNPYFELRANKFVIKHYAGDVTYDINGITDKNKDQLQKDLIELIGTTTNTFLSTIFLMMLTKIQRDGLQQQVTKLLKVQMNWWKLCQKLSLPISEQSSLIKLNHQMIMMITKCYIK